MSRLLRDPRRKLCTILAEGRRARPVDFHEKPISRSCPFCPGNEDLTPPEISRVGDPWQVRVFPNKYPATRHHEIIVDTPVHGVDLAELSPDQLGLAISVWRDRVIANYALRGVRYVSLFHNEGERAGASREHTHTQLIGLEFTPPGIKREKRLFRRDACAMRGLREEGFFVYENGSVVAFCPGVPRFPYETWIVPREHQGLLPEDPGDLAQALSLVLRGIKRLLGGPAYNIIIKTMPGDWHWRCEIVPRTGYLAGFELDTDCHIVSVAPERAAEEIKTAL